MGIGDWGLGLQLPSLVSPSPYLSLQAVARRLFRFPVQSITRLTVNPANTSLPPLRPPLAIAAASAAAAASADAASPTASASLNVLPSTLSPQRPLPRALASNTAAVNAAIWVASSNRSAAASSPPAAPPIGFSIAATRCCLLARQQPGSELLEGRR